MGDYSRFALHQQLDEIFDDYALEVLTEPVPS